MKKLALALAACAFVAVAAPTFAEDTTPATDATTATEVATPATDATSTKTTKKHKKHSKKAHKKQVQQEVAKTDVATPADATQPTTEQN